MTTNLSDLLKQQTQVQVFDLLLAVMQANGFPVTSWQPGCPERTELMAFSSVLVDLVTNYIPTITGGGFLDYATTEWLRLLSEQQYNLPYNGATSTIGDIVLTANASSGPYTIAAGAIRIVFGASGNRYVNQSSATIPNNGSVSTPFIAETTGAKYNDPSSSGDITLVDSLPGVTVTNPASSYTSVSHVGSGTGTLTLGGSPVGSHQVLVQIDSTGASGVAGWSTSLDGGTLTSQGVVSSITNLGGVGVNITLTNGGSGTSFVEGDTYLFSTPGSWITTQGSDDESNDSLKTRCRNRWSSLSDIATEEYYHLLATSTPTVGSQVTQVITQVDENINNRINIVVSGPAGALPGGTVSSIQSYISNRARITDNPVVQSPSGVDITIAGTVYVSFSQLAAAQAAAQTALLDYVNNSGINGTILLSKVIELLMEIQGVARLTVSSITINGAAADFVLGGPSSFQVGELLLPLSLTWVTV